MVCSGRGYEPAFSRVSVAVTVAPASASEADSSNAVMRASGRVWSLTENHSEAFEKPSASAVIAASKLSSVMSLPFDWTVNVTLAAPAGMVTEVGISRSSGWSLVSVTVSASSVAVLRLTVTSISLPSVITERVELSDRVGPSLS